MHDEGIDVHYLIDDPEARVFKSEFSSLAQQLSENVVFGIVGNFGYDLIKAFASFYWKLARDTGKDGTIRIARNLNRQRFHRGAQHGLPHNRRHRGAHDWLERPYRGWGRLGRGQAADKGSSRAS